MNSISQHAWDVAKGRFPVNELKYLRIHKYVKYSCLPTSLYVVLKAGVEEEVAALLLLLGGRKVTSITGRWEIRDKTSELFNRLGIPELWMYRDDNKEWVVSRGGLVAFGVIGKEAKDGQT